MRDIRPCAIKKQSDLTSEWNRLALERHHQILSGEDLSFEHVLVPTIFRLLQDADTTIVLDIGSGTGDLTSRIAKMSERTLGVEPSSASVEVARITCSNMGNVTFIESPLEEAVNSLLGERVTVAVASMMLMTTPNLPRFAESLSSLLGMGAKFIATLTHPCFWPRYWGYEKESWFNYSSEIFIEAPFVISRRSTDLRTTHIHRPLEQYVEAFSKVGLQIETMIEPMPPPQIQALYPKPWEFPRFIGLRWVKVL